MKKEIPMPLVVGIIVVVVALVGFFIYQGTGTRELKKPEMSEEVKNTVPDYLPDEVKQKLQQNK